jgi:hypothetical protein
MEYSEDILQIIEALNIKSGNSLRKEADLAVILELIAAKLDHELLNRIVFSGKSLWKISETLRRASGSSELTDKLEYELKRHINDLVELISNAIEDAEEYVVSRFNVTYLEITQGSVRNLIDLSHDLALLKELQS